MQYKTLMESVRAMSPSFVVNPTSNYTFRFIFNRKADDGKIVQSFGMITGLWTAIESAYERVQADDTITSCITEYVCQYDSSVVGACFLVKEKQQETEEENKDTEVLS